MNESKLTLLQLKNYDNAYVNKELEKMINQLDVETDRSRQEETHKQIADSHTEYQNIYQVMNKEVMSMNDDMSVIQVAIDKKERLRTLKNDPGFGDTAPDKIMEKIAIELTNEVIREERNATKEYFDESIMTKKKYMVGSSDIG